MGSNKKEMEKSATGRSGRADEEECKLAFSCLTYRIRDEDIRRLLSLGGFQRQRTTHPRDASLRAEQ